MIISKNLHVTQKLNSITSKELSQLSKLSQDKLVIDRKLKYYLVKE